MTRTIDRDKIMDWLETMSNRRTDLWMRTAVRNFVFYRPWMRGAVIAPTARMNGGYILRTLGLIFAGLVISQLVFLIVALAAFYGALMYRAHTLHGGASLPPVHDALAVYKQLMEIVLPFYGFLACVYPAITLIWLCYRAFFWNRRALRLQANPTDTVDLVPNPSVWPPPPRVSG